VSTAAETFVFLRAFVAVDAFFVAFEAGAFEAFERPAFEAAAAAFEAGILTATERRQERRAL